MKKFSILFSILAVLLTVTFTSCGDINAMEPLTEDMIGEWIIGTWDVETNTEIKKDGKTETTKETDTYEIDNLNDIDLSSLKTSIFISNGTNYSVLVNKARTKIEMNSTVKVSLSFINVETYTSIVMTKR